MQLVRPPFFTVMPVLTFARAVIIYRIWRKSEPGFLRFIRAVAESGLLYTFTSIATLCAIFVRDLPNGSPYPLMIASAIVCRLQHDILTTMTQPYFQNLPVAGIAYDLMILIVIWAAKNKISSSTVQNMSNIEFNAVASKISDVEQITPSNLA